MVFNPLNYVQMTITFIGVYNVAIILHFVHLCTGLQVIRYTLKFDKLLKRPVKSKRKIPYYNVRGSILFGSLLRSGLLFLSTQGIEFNICSLYPLSQATVF